MKKISRLLVACFTLVSPTMAFASGGADGCYVCKDAPGGLGLGLGLNQVCAQVENGQWGTGIKCETETLMLSTVCFTSGGMCLYFEVWGGTYRLPSDRTPATQARQQQVESTAACDTTAKP
ncbi:MAG: hypothetical protein JOZ54_05325 [Acidobacteria bacterium]|nr:hypothetical protein [Acidobacteriota bacterium]